MRPLLLLLAALFAAPALAQPVAVTQDLTLSYNRAGTLGAEVRFEFVDADTNAVDVSDYVFRFGAIRYGREIVEAETTGTVGGLAVVALSGEEVKGMSPRVERWRLAAIPDGGSGALQWWAGGNLTMEQAAVDAGTYDAANPLQRVRVFITDGAPVSASGYLVAGPPGTGGDVDLSAYLQTAALTDSLDARLTDYPLTATYDANEDGVFDVAAIPALPATILGSGTLDPDRLPANVAYYDSFRTISADATAQAGDESRVILVTGSADVVISLPQTAGVFATSEFVTVFTHPDYTGTVTFAPANGSVTVDGTYTLVGGKKLATFFVVGIDEYSTIDTGGGGDVTQAELDAVAASKAPLYTCCEIETASFSFDASHLGMIVEVTGAGPYTATFPAGLADSTTVLLWNSTSDSLTVAGASAAYKVPPGAAAVYAESPSGTDVWRRLPGGGSGGSTDAADINIADAGTYYTGGTVEAALQEVGADLATVPVCPAGHSCAWADQGDGTQLYVATDDVATAAPTLGTVTAGDGQLTVPITMPADADVQGYELHRSTSTFTATQGTASTLVNLVASGLTPSQVINYVDDGSGSGTGASGGAPVNGTTYYYRAFARDEVPNWSVASNEVSGTPTGAALADLATNRMGHFALRRVEPTHTGPIARLRRSSDDDLADVCFHTTGFVTLASLVDDDLDGACDDGDLTTWVGANSAYGALWYTQDDRDVDMQQTTAASQPRLINAGTLDTDSDGAVAWTFDGVNDHFIQKQNGIEWIWATGGGTNAVPNEVFVIGQSANATEGGYMTGSQHSIGLFGGLWRIVNTSTAVTGGTGDTNAHVFAARFQGAGSTLRLDGVQIATGDPGGTAVSSAFIGSLDAVSSIGFWEGKIREVIYYDGAPTSSTDVEADLEAYEARN